MSVITLNFEGYAQCRLATDPDPTDERRGVSGYTFALPGEPDLDWTIYTQPGPGVVTRPAVNRPIGVKVTSGFAGGEPITAGHPLMGATINLEDHPRFEERNYVVVNKQFGVIAPFKFRIKGNGVDIFRQVDFYPGKPLSTPVWETPQSVLMPYTMQGYNSPVAECAALLGPSQDPSVYRAQRLADLRKFMASARMSPDLKAACDKRVEQLLIDKPTDRRTFQLVSNANYTYALNGPASIGIGKGPLKWLNGSFGADGQWSYTAPHRPINSWPCNFWIGSWDADSLTMYMSGTVQLFDLGNLLDGLVVKGK